MLTLQHRQNENVMPGWQQVRHPYLRAVVLKGSSALEHAGWEWWKRPRVDQAQLALDLVDIWQFGLSNIILEHNGDLDAAADHLATRAGLVRNPDHGSNTVIFDGKSYSLRDLDLVSKSELLIGLACAKRFSIAVFESTMIAAGFDWERVFLKCVGKAQVSLLGYTGTEGQ